jgi:hypothetical protein
MLGTQERFAPLRLSSNSIPQRCSTNFHWCASAFDYFQVIHYCRIP